MWQGLLLAGVLGAWQGLVQYGFLPVFFFGEPVRVFGVLREWVVSGLLFPHLGVTLTETLAAFLAGTGLGIGIGLWLGLSPFAARLLDPYLKAANAMPRVVLAPIFAMWFR